MSDELSHTERLLMGELFKLSQEISSFVLRAMGADAEQMGPITAKEEFELGVRLAELGAVLRVRARERREPLTETDGNEPTDDEH
jgi:hypothetical protein